MVIRVVNVIGVSSYTSEKDLMESNTLNEFATRYTAAWCSQDAERVASFFSPDGSLKINNAVPSVGRPAIAAAAQVFMTAFPDLLVSMDSLLIDGGKITYHWTLTGCNTGPEGTGRRVRISGYEEWRLGADGLIAESKGQFDVADYQRQLLARVDPTRDLTRAVRLRGRHGSKSQLFLV